MLDLVEASAFRYSSGCIDNLLDGKDLSDKRMWKLISQNDLLDWSFDAIKRYKDHLIFKVLCSKAYDSIFYIDPIKSRVDELSGFLKEIAQINSWDKSNQCLYSGQNQIYFWKKSDFLKKCEDIIDWTHFTRNFNHWNYDKIAEFKDQIDWDTMSYYHIHNLNDSEILNLSKFIDWDRFSINPHSQWTTDRLRLLKNKLNWRYILKSDFLPWSQSFIEEFKDKILVPTEKEYYKEVYVPDPDHPFSFARKILNIKKAPSSIWTKEALIMHASEIDWCDIDIPDIVDEDVFNVIPSHGLNWYALSKLECFSIPANWEKYSSRIKWHTISSRSDVVWSVELLRNYLDDLDWIELSNNESLPWSEELIKEFYYKWDWTKLSSNKSMPWSEELIRTFEGNWDFKRLSKNSSIPWSEAIIDQYLDLLFWGGNFVSSYDDDYGVHKQWIEEGLTMNISWTLELLTKYQEYVDWNSILDSKLLELTEDIIDKFIDKWNWKINHKVIYFQLTSMTQENIITNDERLIEKYEDYICWDYISKYHTINIPFYKKYQNYLNLDLVLLNDLNRPILLEYLKNLEITS